MRRKATLKTFILLQRINELEEIICPTRSHDFKKTATILHYTSNGDAQTEHEYMCTKCKRVERT